MVRSRGCRMFHVCVGGTRSAGLKSSVSLAAIVKNAVETVQETSSRQVPLKKISQGAVKSSSVLKSSRGGRQFTSDTLMEKFKSKAYIQPAKSDIVAINKFFENAQVKTEWSASTFLQVPGEAARNREEIERKIEDNVQNFQIEELDELDKELSKVEAKYKDETFTTLPEIIFLGRCNVGKSTLLNALLSDMSLAKNTAFAKASKHAGYTQMLHSFNVGGRFRLIDSPGYGKRGRAEQGQLVMEYLEKRKDFVKCYLLLPSADTLSQSDFEIIKLLENYGIPFDAVFTKIDKLKNLNSLDYKFTLDEIKNNNTLQDVFFVSSEKAKHLPRQGMGLLRASIFQSCGFEPKLKALRNRERSGK